MTKSKSDGKPSNSNRRWWNRLQLVLIFVVFAAPIVAAFVYKPTSFVNFGDLYSPVRVVDNLKMRGPDGLVEMDSLRHKWVFLVTASQVCTDICEENILKIRQVRAMQNVEMTRVRTVFLHTGLTPERDADLRAKYRPMEVYAAEPVDFSRWTQVLRLDDAPDEAQINRIYIIDPAGNLMMSYPAGTQPDNVKRDVKRLLKASQIG